MANGEVDNPSEDPSAGDRQLQSESVADQPAVLQQFGSAVEDLEAIASSLKAAQRRSQFYVV